MTSQKDCAEEKLLKLNLLSFLISFIKGSAVVLPFLFLSHWVSAKPDKSILTFSALHIEAQNALFRFEIPKVRSLLKKDPNSVVSAYLLEMSRCFEEMLGSSPYTGHSIENTIQRLALAPEHPNQALLMADLYVYAAMNAINNNEQINASRLLLRAWNTLRKSQPRYPEEVFSQKFLLFFGAFSPSAPEQFKWLAEQSGLNMDPVKAIQELDRLSTIKISRPEQQVWQFETSLFAAFLTRYALKKPREAYMRIERLLGSKPDCPMHSFMFNAMALQSGHSHKILLKEQEKFFPFLPYLAHQNGMARLQALDTTAASACFRQFIALQKGEHLLKSSWHKLSWIAALSGKSLEYKKYCESCSKEGKTLREEDRYALRQCTEGECPHPDLLKMRLLYDGGRIEEAFELAKDLHYTQFESVSQKTEYLYRKGRIAEAMGLTETALKFYKACAETGASQKSYYACKSCLLIAGHYQNKGQCKVARAWYLKAYNNKYVEEYRKSMKEEAQKGLKQCP